MSSYELRIPCENNEQVHLEKKNVSELGQVTVNKPHIVISLYVNDVDNLYYLFSSFQVFHKKNRNDTPHRCSTCLTK